MYLAVKKSVVFANILLLKTIFAENCHLYNQLYSKNNTYAIVNTAPELCQHGDFFPEK